MNAVSKYDLIKISGGAPYNSTRKITNETKDEINNEDPNRIGNYSYVTAISTIALLVVCNKYIFRGLGNILHIANKKETSNLTKEASFRVGDIFGLHKGIIIKPELVGHEDAKTRRPEEMRIRYEKVEYYQIAKDVFNNIDNCFELDTQGQITNLEEGEVYKFTDLQDSIKIQTIMYIGISLLVLQGIITGLESSFTNIGDNILQSGGVSFYNNDKKDKGLDIGKEALSCALGTGIIASVLSIAFNGYFSKSLANGSIKTGIWNCSKATIGGTVFGGMVGALGGVLANYITHEQNR